MVTKELEKTINAKLSKLNFPQYTDLDSRIQNYISETEQIFSQIMKSREEAIKAYKSNKISVKFIAEKLNVERQTVHNHPYLYEYVRYLQSEQQEEDIFNKVKNLNDKLNEMEKDFLLLYKRDVTIEELKLKIKDLESEILDRDIENENLLKESKVNKVNPNEENNVIKMRGKLEDE